MLLVLSFVSFLLQATAFVLAIRMLKSVRYHPSFILMATVIGLMAVRRVVVIGNIFITHDVVNLHLPEELLAVAISVLFVAGFWRLRKHMLELYAAETRLADSEARLRAMVDQVGDGILIRQPDGKILAVNARFCALTGHSSDHLVGQKVLCLIPPMAADRWTHQASLQFTGDCNRIVQSIACQDGRVLELEIHSRRRSDGQIDDFVRDVTEYHMNSRLLETAQTELADIGLTAGVFAVRVSPQFRWLTIPEPLAGLLGYTRDQLQNRPTREITFPDDALVEWRLTQQLSNSDQRSAEFDRRLTSKNGGIVRFRVVRRAVMNKQGGCEYYVDVMRQVTSGETSPAVGQPVAAEEFIVHPDERFRMAAEIAGDTVYDIDLQQGVVWLSVPARFRSCFPDVTERLTVEEWLTHVHSDDRARVKDVHASALDSGDTLDAEYRLAAPADDTVWVRNTGRITRDSSRQAIRMVGTLRDVSGTHAATEALASSEERFRLALRNSLTVVFTADRDLRYTWVFNSSRPSSEAIVGKSDFDLFDHVDAVRMVALKRRVLETGQPERVDIDINFNGRQTHFIGHVEALRDAGGKIVGVTGAVTDVTDLKMLQIEASQRQSRLKILSEIATRILSNESIQSIVQRTLAELSEELPHAHVAQIYLDANGVIVDARPLTETLAPLVRDRVVFPGFGRSGHTPSVGQLIDWECSTSATPAANQVRWIDAGIHSILAVPVQKSDDRLDVLTAAFGEAHATTEHERLLVNETAEQLSVAMKFAREQEDRRRAEAALRESEERFRVAAYAGIDGFMMLQAVSNIAGEITDFRVSNHNSAADEVLRGICIVSDGKTLVDMIGPKRGRDFTDLFRRVLVAGQPMEMEFQSELAHSPTWLHLQVVPTKDGVAVWTRNVTNRVRNEFQMRRLSTAVEQSPNMVYITNTHGVIEYVNQQFTAITGYSPVEVIGRSDRMLRSADADPNVHAEITAALAHGRRWVGKTRKRRKDGTLYWERTTVAPILNDAGFATSYVTVASDITEELYQQEKLMESDKLAAVGMLAAGVSHEFKNYLGGIIGNATFALSELETNQDIDLARRTLEDIVSMGDRANNVAMSLLSYSKTSPERFGPEDLVAIVKNTTTLIAKELHHRSIDLYTHFDALPPLRLSAGKIQQLLLNLMINAEQAIGSKGIISVSVMRFDNSVQLRVTDNGQGIPAANLARVFDPFFSTKGVWGKDGVVGTGMGLAICRNIAREHGGELTVDSTEGVGSTFTLSLPASLIDGSPAESHSSTSADDSPVKVVVFSLDRELFAAYFARACELGITLCPADDFTAIRDGLQLINGLVVCDAEFIGKIELTRVVERCQDCQVPYVLVRCGGLDYQIEHLYPKAAGVYRGLPSFEDILAGLKASSSAQVPG